MRARLAVALAAAGALTLVAGVAAPASALTSFQTPSRNIGCVVASNTLRCDIATTSVRPPKRPASCDLDFGNAFAMNTRARPRRLCAGDTALGSGPVLAYGRTRRIGVFACTSKVSGLTCTNRNRHGWTLAKSSIRLF